MSPLEKQRLAIDVVYLSSGFTYTVPFNNTGTGMYSRKIVKQLGNQATDLALEATVN
jgi:hypothetical protein